MRPAGHGHAGAGSARSCSIAKRERLARFCDRTGITDLLERVSSRPSLMVLSYHRIGQLEDCRSDPLFSVTSDDLDLQIGYLKSRFHLTTLEEVQELVARRSRWRHCKVLLTFDDGYIDSYTVALSILRSHGVQGTFFLPTSFIGTRLLPWWDRIASMIRQTSKKRLTLHYPVPAQIEISQPYVRAAIEKVNALYKSPLNTDTSYFLTALAEACGVDIPERSPERLFLDWHEAAAMVDCGMAIGSHTGSHELLARLSIGDEYEELRSSRAFLREKIGVETVALAYPVGLRASFSPRTRAALHRAGYQLGFSLYGGINLPLNVQSFDIRRISVGFHLSFPLFRLRTIAATTLGKFIL